MTPSSLHHRFFAGLLILWLVFLGVFLMDRFPPPWPDEGLYADIVNHWVHHGGLGIPLFQGYFSGIENHQHFYPPLYFLLLGGIFEILPLNLLTLRGTSLLFVVLILILLRARIFKGLSPWAALGLSAILLFDPVVVRSSLIGRMDALATLLSLAALLTLHHAEKATVNKRQNLLFCGSGVLLGLGFLTHPMAWAVVAGVGLYALIQWSRRHLALKQLFAVSLCGLVVISPYLFWVYMDWNFFREQFAAQLARKQQSAGGLNQFLSSYEGLYSQYGQAKVFGVALALLGWWGLLQRTLENARGLKFLLSHLILVALTAASGEMWYTLYLLPTTWIGAAHIVKRRPRKWIHVSLVIIGLGYVFTLGHQAFITHEKSWKKYCENLSRHTSASDSIFLASVPDAFFCFPTRPEKMGQFIPNAIPISPERATDVFDQFNVFIGGEHFLGEHLQHYLHQRRDSFDWMDEYAGGYRLQIARRKPGQ